MSLKLLNCKETELTVTDAMMLNAIASPATMYRKLTNLLDARLIEKVFEGKNRRTKYLAPTHKQTNILISWQGLGTCKSTS